VALRQHSRSASRCAETPSRCGAVAPPITHNETPRTRKSRGVLHFSQN
jgi:hypothetical protein